MAYVTSATTKGGRNGRAMLDNGALALAMALPKELGGAGDAHNPEQLFALGYSSCFGQAILVVAKKHGIDGQAALVDFRQAVMQRFDQLGAALRVVQQVVLQVRVAAHDPDVAQDFVQHAGRAPGLAGTAQFIQQLPR